MIAARNKQKQTDGGKKKLLQNSVEAATTQKELAKIAAKAKENQQARKGNQAGATPQNSAKLAAEGWGKYGGVG